MSEHKIFNMPFAKVYPLYVNKAKRKNRTEDEVVELITWLTGYKKDELIEICNQGISIRTFFNQAPHMNENIGLIKGSICGVKIEEIEDPLMKKIRQLDKIIDELAKGKELNKIKR